MFSRWPRVGALAVMASLVGLGVGAALTRDGPRPGEPRPGGPRRPGPPGGPGGGFGEAYDRISLLSRCVGPGRAKLAAEDARLLESAREFYRAALQARQAGDVRRADEMGRAANDAARGLAHALNASNPSADRLPLPPEPPPPPDVAGPGPGGPRPGKGKDRDDPPPPKGKDAPPPGKDRDDPAPPPGKERPGKDRDAPPPPPDAGRVAPQSPEDVARDAVRRLRDRPDDRSDENAARTGRPFFEASRRANQAAQAALEERDYRKATEWARAAEAWSKVSEHLSRAEDGSQDAPPDRAPPSPDGKRPPPPPRERERE